MKTTRADAQQRALLLGLVDEAYDHTAWHGPNLKGSLRRILPEEALWRAKPGRKNVAEIAVHCAYWKYAVRRRLLGQKRGSFPLKGSNWFVLPARFGKPQWRECIDLLDEQHQLLRRAIEEVRLPGRTPTGRSSTDVMRLICGIALHDTYHAGQIRTLKVLYKQARLGRSKSAR
ncbi:MAG: DinB family protein [Phycisphaerae bacterium]